MPVLVVIRSCLSFDIELVSKENVMHAIVVKPLLALKICVCFDLSLNLCTKFELSMSKSSGSGFQKSILELARIRLIKNGLKMFVVPRFEFITTCILLHELVVR